MTDEEFFQRLRGDARALRHQPDEVTLARIRARIEAHIAKTQPSVAQLLAAWFRPLAATAVALALAGVIGTTIVRNDDAVFATNDLEITAAGETYRVGD